MSTRQHTRIPAANNITALLALIAACLLSACLPTPAATHTQANPTTSQAPAIPAALAKYHDKAVAQSTQFELRQPPDVVPYNPCKDIREDQLPALGLKPEIIDLETKIPGQIAYLCKFGPGVTNPPVVAIQHDYMPRSAHQVRNEFIGMVNDPRYPNAYFFTQSYKTKNTSDCGMAIHTTHGRFAVIFEDQIVEDPLVESCPKTFDYFEKFYALENVQEGLYGDH